MSTRTQQGAAHEVWVESDPSTFTGTSPATVITTAIQTSTADVNHTRVRLYLTSVTGVPVVLAPTAALVPDPSGRPWNVLQLTFQNTSGNIADSATWKLEVERIWSASR